MTPYFVRAFRILIKVYGVRSVYLSMSRNRTLRRMYRKFKSLRPFYMEKQLFASNELVIMGRPVISQIEWEKRKVKELQSRKQIIPKYIQDNPTKQNIGENQNFGIKFQLGVIVSIYRPNEMLSPFLGNLEEQSIFESTQVTLVLVDPVVFEIEMLTAFCQKHVNVKLITIEKRITIYEAWNIAIRQTKTKYLTNMNIDDFRSFNSLETQLMFMLDRPWVDVGYQDFYYMRDRDLDWNSVVSLDAKSDLPPVTLLELAWFGINPPHNAPIWRRELHERYGEFDENLQSAGDYEFWMRVFSKGARFVKMPVSTIGYFINPQGMSTSSDSPSAEEERALQEKYRGAIVTSSLKFPELKIPERFASNPWDASELFTQIALKELRKFSE